MAGSPLALSYPELFRVTGPLFWTLECLFRGNVGIHRAPKAIQVDGSRPRRVSWQGFPGSLPSLVLRAEDMWQRYNLCLEVDGALNQGFPFSSLMSHFRGLRDGVEYKFLDCI